MTAFELTKALLRGKFVDVSRFRNKSVAAFNKLPKDLVDTANRFLGQAAGDAQGREVLSQWLRDNPGAF